MFNTIARRSRVTLLQAEILAQARAARRCEHDPADLAGLASAFPMVAGLVGAARLALQSRHAASLAHGFVYLGHRYRLQVCDAGAFQVLTWGTREPLIQSPPGAV
ncbi:MAG: hypothetical protein A3E25_02385 [Burkholderiales bacterium RIFCSPHIGHO2_12_FULL_69_20]|nr:MAG: hypothetical protein A3E25_02385 [Burkholderiales bacterium RIFCSPHIGHO2_12_FULL_69_20]